ncbi:hypothetical protein Q668_18330 [Alcanivorax sp. PN-3]|nr:hypothetical protein Q668_18330 [Alcanivorax sp. PN-3]
MFSVSETDYRYQTKLSSENGGIMDWLARYLFDRTEEVQDSATRWP